VDGVFRHGSLLFSIEVLTATATTEFHQQHCGAIAAGLKNLFGDEVTQ
jgi:hypothetical protein